ncbi:DUF1127 domain-containing protein [Limobrevibacterium gyesilva]|uniref:DUF1127 domain-containing protein n=1 Tax=Limobrevibacterium gyesilva TaxID=2991712 RepID=A0AA41YWE4_9PROT|nr:DUF1127 domain-containing protein [Limobrevibacterium gyesilva]MCW3477610.1 DUF1127 domain-containing protein [Limobrevibacterium gyesilva]
MNAHVSKEEIALLLPNSLSHYFKDEVEYMPQPEPQPLGLFAKVGAAVRWLIEMPRRRAVLDELSSLTDHELADIGLTRSELTRVFDPEFAARRNADRASLRAANGRFLTA